VNFTDPDGRRRQDGPLVERRADAAAALGREVGAQTSGAVSDFRGNLNEMVDTNFIGSDKFFHCRANCQATSRGGAGEVVAVAGSTFRELRQGAADKANGTSNPADTAEDVVANRAGRDAGRGADGATCTASCSSFSPPGLMTELGFPELEPPPPPEPIVSPNPPNEDQIQP